MHLQACIAAFPYGLQTIAVLQLDQKLTSGTDLDLGVGIGINDVQCLGLWSVSCNWQCRDCRLCDGLRLLHALCSIVWNRTLISRLWVSARLLLLLLRVELVVLPCHHCIAIAC